MSGNELASSAPRKPSAMTVSVETLGAKGDGIAATDLGPVYVPLSLPGERVEVELDEEILRGRIVRIIEPSPDRQTPLCRHFGQCGGCALQHMAPRAYLEWKRKIIIDAFAARGLEVMVDPVRTIGPGTRRRAVLSARRTKKTVQLGFHGPRDAKVVDLAECPVLHEDMVQLLPKLKALVGPLLTRKGEARVVLTRAANGFDVGLSGVRAQITAADRADLAAQAQDIGLLRLTIDDEVIAEQMPPLVRFADVDVALPTGTFLQASREADAMMAQLVVAALDPAGKAAHVADLFCGAGTLSLPLARRVQVTSIDNDEAAVKALDQAVRHAQGLKPVSTRMRDLFHEPLSGKELTAFDGIVFDPPRAGAKAQAEALAAAKVPLVVAVSCNPKTLARDLRILVDGGYKIERITPVDQFVFSAHVETVVILRR